ncbi:MAG TPA: glycoside hydrolase family 97 N-terminal domain-containing protein, partial [Bacteroidales bacterium]|nr:glycoside hydrolase family 97 N-terminal domain-containing protein [Bacteroidales bacterium]
MKKFLALSVLMILCPFLTSAQKSKTYEVKSPDGTIILKVEAGAKMLWSVQHNGQLIIAPSSVSLQLDNGELLGPDAKVSSAKTTAVNTSFNAINYRKSL